MKKLTVKSIALILVFVLLAAVSFFLLADFASSPETHAEALAAIDEKADTVLKLTAASTIASAGISAIPGDTATPIAEKLADFSEYFLLILTVLYAEKYLLTIIGAAAFKVVIPAAFLCFAAAVVYDPDSMKRRGTKFILFALLIYLTIPASLRVSDMIYNSYSESIETTLSSAEEFSDEAEEFTEEKSGAVGSILSTLTDTTNAMLDNAASVLNRFIEALAVMIVTSCVIPILVLLFFVWIIRVFTGASVPMPRTILPHRRKKSAIK